MGKTWRRRIPAGSGEESTHERVRQGKKLKSERKRDRADLTPKRGKIDRDAFE